MKITDETVRLRKEILAHLKYSNQINGNFVMERVDKLVGRINDFAEHYSETWLEKPDQDHECKTWYDGCHCTVSTLMYNIGRAEKAEAKLAKMKEALLS